MKLKILSWNVRGLHEKDKRFRIRNLLKLWGPHIICFQETKIGIDYSGYCSQYLGFSSSGLGVSWLQWGIRWYSVNVGYQGGRESRRSGRYFFCFLQIPFSI
jgi:endonuclease/exonuclease/phosphatase family metal-dependent hydrolase